MKYSSNITPKGLTEALRELEVAGIIEREEQSGHREVWYRLTEAGEDLRPVVEAMKEWGLKHAMRPPLPGEVVHPDLEIWATFLAVKRSERDKYTHFLQLIGTSERIEEFMQTFVIMNKCNKPKEA